MISEIKQRALHRAKILEGQMRGLQKMVAKEDYCIDILTQSLAAQKSLRSFNKLLLENHLKTCVDEKFAAKSGNAKKGAITELLELYELSSVRSN